MSLARPAFPMVIAAPSGAGKTTLARMLVERHDDVVFSVSATTRPPRRGERHGRDYHFVHEATFDRMIEHRELCEWAVVHGRRYGTPRQGVAGALERGRTVVLDIDVKGARQVRKVFPNALLIFVLPPSAQELAGRLTGRASEDPDGLRRRLANAQREIEAARDFEYVIINDDLDRAYGDLEAILCAERARARRIPDLDALTRRLVHDLGTLIADA